jgi:MscS family membrane protein
MGHAMLIQLENVVSETITYVQSALSPITGISDISLAIVILALSVLLAVTFNLLISRVVVLILVKTRSTLDEEVMAAINGPAQVFIVLSGLFLALRSIKGLPDSIGTLIDPSFSIAAIFIAAYIVSRVSHVSLEWFRKENDHSANARLDRSMLSFLKKSLSLVVYAVAIMMALTRLNVEITPLLASLGVAGIAVALAAQELLSNVFGAFAILSDKPYKIGDRIELSDGEYGDVVDIGLRSTRIKTLDNRIVIIPNAEMSKSKINNYSEPDPMLRYSIKIGISYRSSVEKASEVLKEIAAGIDGALKDPAPIVYVDGFGDYSIKIVMLVWGKDFRENWDIPDKIYRQALKRFSEEGIEIPYPVTTVVYPCDRSAPEGRPNDAPGPLKAPSGL